MPNHINQPPPLPHASQKLPTLPPPHTPCPLTPPPKRLLHPLPEANLLNHRRRRDLLPQKTAPRDNMHRFLRFRRDERPGRVAGVESYLWAYGLGA